MNDKYSRAISYLKKHPDEISWAWEDPYFHKAGCLFVKASNNNKSHICGCLTQIRLGYWTAETPELTKEIASDGRIPYDPDSITLADLPVFAEWQRRLDKELKRS